MYGYTFSIYAFAILLLFVVSKMQGHNFLWLYDFLEWGYLLTCALGSKIGGTELLRVWVLTAWYAAGDKIKPIKESGPQSLFQTSAPKLISTALASGGRVCPSHFPYALSSHDNNQQHLPACGVMALIREPSFPEECRKYEMLGTLQSNLLLERVVKV